MRQTAPRRWDWVAAIVLVGLLYTAAARLSVTTWTRELGYVEGVVVLGAILGLALGVSRFSGRTAAWLAGAYTLLQIGWQMMRVADQHLSALDQLINGAGRLGVTLGQLWTAQRIDDPIFFVTLMSTLYWGIGLSCGYRLMRGSRLLSVLVVPTIPVLIVQYYDGYESNRLWIVAFYFFLVLLLIGRVNLLEKEKTWLARRVSTANQPEYELAGSIVGLAAGIILLAWVSPTPAVLLPNAEHAWQQASQPFEGTRQWINNVLAAVRDNSGTGIETYADSMGLGIVANQGTEEVFAVSVASMNFPRYHWRMRVYDTYADGSWDTAAGSSQKFTPERADLSIAESKAAHAADFWFQWKTGPGTLMPLPSQPVWVSRPGEIQFDEAAANQLDVLSWHSDLSMRSGDQYEAHAILVNPGVASLRQAGTNYPDWVVQHDLQLPADLPQDIRALAKTLAQGQATPYDRATAITAYLRSNIKYSSSIPSAPAGVEPLDWFLFTQKSGFCNYYASADVVMLRSVGIPARMAVGYAQGELAADGTLIVHQRDAHAWPEVYFPGIGWVDFEPTSSQPDIVRASGLTQPDSAATPASPAGKAVNPPSRRPQDNQNDGNGNTIDTTQTVGVWVIIFILVSAVAGAVWFLGRKKNLGQRLPRLLADLYHHYGFDLPLWLERWERWSESGSIERSFHAINQSLAWLGKPQPAHMTATERAELLKTILPSLSEEIDILREQHERTLFGPLAGDAAQARRAAWRIRYLTIRSMVRRLVGANDE